MSSINCPYCRHVMVIKGLKPGRFTPKCTQCSRKFLLSVPPDLGAPPEVAALKSEVDAGATVAPVPRAAATVATGSPVAADATAPPRPSKRVKEAAATETVGPPRRHHGVGESTAAAIAQSVVVEEDSEPPRRKPTNAPTPLTDQDQELTGALGGYELLKRIGAGAMGQVYLARQVSLDRPVAVKVMRPEWATNPEFVARFTREAYAAAQLVHHNVVQIHDIGARDATHYFSMEFVDGKTLADLVRQQGKLDPEVAVGYALQAARALKFAHDNGMIHRDIKPENLLLDRHGVVKVADLGLVKTPKQDVGDDDADENRKSTSSDLEKTIGAMGTPAYIAPEQVEDASKVDGRADIYSLGCTLYDLVTGSPPFTGKTAAEVMTKHITEPITPPERLVSRVPPALSRIILRMCAKKPADRYPNMGEAIKALEGFLGIDSTGPFSPREEHARQLEEAAQKFNASGKANARRWAIRGYFAACAAAIVILAAMGAPMWAGGVLGLAVLTFLSYVVLTGLTQKTHVFLKLRHLAFGASWGDWATWTFGLAASVLVLYAVNLLWVWLAFCVAAVVIAVGFHALIDRAVVRERKPEIDSVEDMLKTMRLKGLEEDALRQFVRKYSGERWEEFYEALFGYESKLDARERWGRGARGRMRPKHAAWRDALIRWIDGRLRLRKEKKERKLLQEIQEKELKAQGVDDDVARERARSRADALVEKAAEFKQTAALRAAETMAPGAAPALTMRHMLAHSEEDDESRRRARSRKHAGSGGVLGLVVGSRTRFVLGALLLAGCFLWLRQNQALTFPPDFSRPPEPLALPLVPESVTAVVFSSLAPAAAGLMLILSMLWRNLTSGIVILVAAVVMVAGASLGIPAILGSPAQTAMALGGLIAVVGFAVGRA